MCFLFSSSFASLFILLTIDYASTVRHTTCTFSWHIASWNFGKRKFFGFFVCFSLVFIFLFYSSVKCVCFQKKMGKGKTIFFPLLLFLSFSIIQYAHANNFVFHSIYPTRNWLFSILFLFAIEFRIHFFFHSSFSVRFLLLLPLSYFGLIRIAFVPKIRRKLTKVK